MEGFLPWYPRPPYEFSDFHEAAAAERDPDACLNGVGHAGDGSIVDILGCSIVYQQSPTVTAACETVRTSSSRHNSMAAVGMVLQGCPKSHAAPR